jgi:hypothetical protein
MQAEKEIPLPKLDELIGSVDDTLAEEEVVRQFTAALVAGTSLVMGLVGNLLFYASPIGINVFLYVALCSLAAFGLLIYLRRPIMRKHAVFAVPAALFALLLGVRLAPQLIVFNAAAMAGSLLIVIHFTGTSQFIGGRWFRPVQRTIETIMIGWLESLRAVLPDSVRWLGQTEPNHQQLTNMRSVLRGVLITLPVVVVFTLLLSSADAVFGDLAEQAVSIVLPESAGSVIEQLFLIAVFTVIALTACWTMLDDRSEASLSPESSAREKSQRFRLNMIEASTVLGSVNFLFVAFVLIQARYFFGGEANITAQGYTYAEYARRGFYELLVVSCMTMLLLVALESLTYRKREEENMFRGLVVLMVALTFVILIAAFQRLNLYENAYGYTRIRMMSGTFMIWLVALLGVLLVAILRHRREVFWIGCIVTGLGFILTLNLMNMDGFIARRNIARFDDTGKLDVGYLLSLSDDAIPTVASLIDNRNLDSFDREQLLRGLGARLYELDRDRAARGVFGYHIGKTRAWQVLDNRRETLHPYLSSRSR